MMLYFVFVWTLCITDILGRPLDYDPYGPAPVLPAPPMMMDRKHGLGLRSQSILYLPQGLIKQTPDDVPGRRSQPFRNERQHNNDFFQYGPLTTNTGFRVRSPIPKRSSGLSNYSSFMIRKNNRRSSFPGSQNSYFSGVIGKNVHDPPTKTVLERRRIPTITFTKIPRVIMKKVKFNVPVVRMVSRIVDLKTGKVLGDLLNIYPLFIGAVECMSCSRVAEPHDCENVVTCAQHEQCFTDFYITPQGHVFYDLGCASNRVCDALNKFGKREVKRQDENLYICQECCNSHRCNRYGCGDQNKLNRTICYSCNDVEHPSKCDTAAVCDIDKVLIKSCHLRHRNAIPNISSMTCFPIDTRWDANTRRMSCSKQSLECHAHKQSLECHAFGMSCQSLECHAHKQSLECHAHKQSLESHAHKQSLESHAHKQSLECHAHKQSLECHAHKQSLESHAHKQSLECHAHKQSLECHAHKQSLECHAHKQSLECHAHKQSWESHAHKQYMCKKMMGKESIIAGHPKVKKQIIGGFDNIDVCYYCCDNNFCNKKDCVNGHPSTQQNMQTSPITTTVTTTTTKRTNPPTTQATSTTTTQRTQSPTTTTTTKVTHPPPTTKKVTHPPPKTTKVTHPPPTTKKVTHPPPTTKKVTHPPPTTKKVTHPPPTTTTIKRTHPPPTTTTTKRTHPPTTTTTTKRTTTPTPTKPAALNCYYCEYSSHEKECNHTTKCNLGEDQCYLSRVDGGADNDNLCFYKMGCMTKTDCHHYRSAIHNNGKAVMAMDTIEYFECCRHSNCNNHVVHKHPQRCNPLTTIKP
ncbi:unnamed protein product [Mytilus coruscus]|uniref:UPAR/Ly6 domain-containing protein n=1 Tax=Mytilus coruscus TaxID=42192 RepID=A0A6J8CQ86_MYTCO|nr:unnamed protein product [Mytilus coruscus]